MRLDTILRSTLAVFLVIALGGCATTSRQNPGLCAAIGGLVGGAGAGVGGYLYSDNNRERDHNQLEGAAIGLGGALVGAGLGYLICNLMEDEAPKPPPPRAAPPPPAPPPAAPPVPREPDVCTDMVRLEEVQFATNQSAISPTAAAVLDKVVTALQRCPETRVRLDAYTDSTGADAYNQALSQRRADSVKAYLVQHGISASRIEARGHGEANPIASNDTAEGRAKNRRVEISPIN